MYVTGNYYRGAYRTPQWGVGTPSSRWSMVQREKWAPTLGTAAGIGKTIYENWPTRRPILAGGATLFAYVVRVAV